MLMLTWNILSSPFNNIAAQVSQGKKSYLEVRNEKKKIEEKNFCKQAPILEPVITFPRKGELVI